MQEETDPVRFTVQGQEFTVRARAGEPGVYDYFWTNHPEGYGFTSAGNPSHPVSREEMERDIISFLAEINPETGFLD
ncbi:hypothetical protein AUQ48_12150 [Kocuria flava]|uniref:Uncharacterized protein n=1 Tax=Kocuria flava TaxID=446860 RepID=A0A2N4T3P7_9MICC|nr:hypothetical protein [Kocuria flava]PLC12845.1 hypothetical protein AUQ48_12150 [Kocuria flava]